MLKRDLLACMLVAILALSCFSACSPNGETCGEMTKWDAKAEKCVPEKVVECAKNTVRKGDKCIPVQEVCEDGKIYDAKEKKCVLKETICDKNSQLDAKTNTCIPKKVIECGPGTVKKGDECVPQKIVECGVDTVEKDGKCVPKPTVCGKGTKLDEKTGKCETISKLDCGPGTSEKDGKCVPADDLCQPGTKADNQGRCIIDAVTCGAGAQLDANTKKCVATDKACGPGTAFTKGKCVPTEKVCTKGTKFDAKLGQCLPDYCREGDVLKNGVCTSPAEILAAKKDVDEKENNDPALGGTPTSLTPKATGALVFQGVIEAPKDFNNDKTVDQDVDVYSFAAKAGQWYKVSVQSLGLSAPGFLVRGLPIKDKAGKITGYEYKRFGSFAVTGSPTRHIFIPQTGTYEIVVLPSIVLVSDSKLNGSGPFNFGPIGSADHKYVGSIELLKSPTAIQVDSNKVSTLKGMVNMPGQSFFQVTNVQAKDLLEAFTMKLGSSAVFRAVLFDGTKRVGEVGLSKDAAYPLGVPPSGKLWVVLTWERAWGADLGFELRVRKQGKYEKVSIKKAANHSMSFSLTADSVVGIFFKADSSTFTSSDRLKVDFQDSTNKSLAKNDNLNDTPGAPAGYTSTSYRLRAYAAKAGTYKVLVNNKTLKDQNIELYVFVFKAAVLGKAKGVGDKVSVNWTNAIMYREYGWMVLDLKEGVSATGKLEGLNSASDDVDIEIFDASMKSLGYRTSTGPIELDREPLTKGTFLFRVYPSSSSAPLSKGFKGSFDLTAFPSQEKEPNNTAATATAWDITANAIGTFAKRDDIDYYKFTLKADMKAGTLYEVKLRAANYSTYECHIYNNAAPTKALWSRTDSRYGCYFLVAGLKAGTYLLMAKYKSSSSNVKYTASMKLWNGTLEKEPNGTNTQALALGDVTKAKIFGNMSSKTDVDYFSFKLASAAPAGQVLAFDVKAYGNNVSSSYASKVEIVDGTGKVLGSASSNQTGYVQASKLTAGNYFVKVSYGYTFYYNYYDVNYSVSFSFLTLSFLTETTSKNDDFASAQTVKYPFLLDGEVPPNDKDYYKLTLAADLKAGEKLEIVLNQRGSGNTSSIGFHAYNSAKKLLGEKVGYTGYPKSLTLSGLKKGDYYIMVDRQSTSTGFKGQYRLGVKITK